MYYIILYYIIFMLFVFQFKNHSRDKNSPFCNYLRREIIFSKPHSVPDGGDDEQFRCLSTA